MSPLAKLCVLAGVTFVVGEGASHLGAQAAHKPVQPLLELPDTTPTQGEAALQAAGLALVGAAFVKGAFKKPVQTHRR